VLWLLILYYVEVECIYNFICFMFMIALLHPCANCYSVIIAKVRAVHKMRCMQ